MSRGGRSVASRTGRRRGATDARRTGYGAQRHGFSATGELERFNPSRFARVPAAMLNGTFPPAAVCAPSCPVVEAQFVPRDSRLAGQPLTGRGDPSSTGRAFRAPTCNWLPARTR